MVIIDGVFQAYLPIRNGAFLLQTVRKKNAEKRALAPEPGLAAVRCGCLPESLAYDVLGFLSGCCLVVGKTQNQTTQTN
jgi:hypothetical protein